MSGLVIVSISQVIHWKSKSDNIQRGYGFRYDQIDRLREAHYAAKPVNGTKWTIENGHYDVPEIRYDFNGNITKVKRAGWFNSGAFGLMDNLTYAYSGNQLSAVTDQITATGPDDFRDNGATSSLDYTYDLNGNMITDANKGLTVEYNHLSLPERMNFGGGDEILLLYDAAGNKLAKRVKQGGSPQATRQYLAGFVYNGTQLEFFATPEGRVVPDASGPEDFRYEYHYRDHLGNTRLCFSDLDGDGDAEETEIMQELHYYPFGMTLNGLGSPQMGAPHLFGYNGKEMQEEFGLGWSDYGARMYDASLGRWMVVDPLAEKYVAWSPYNYVSNNPINLLDRDGREPDRKRSGTILEAILQWAALEDLSVNGIVNFMKTGKDAIRFVYTKDEGWMDLQHFFGTLQYGKGQMDELERVSGMPPVQTPVPFSTGLGEGAEDSYYSYEDLPSNRFAARNFSKLVEYSNPGKSKHNESGGKFVFKSDSKLVSTVYRLFSEAGATTPEEAPNWRQIPYESFGPNRRRRIPHIRGYANFYAGERGYVTKQVYHTREEQETFLRTGLYVPQNRSGAPYDLNNFPAAPTSLEKGNEN